MSSKSRQNDFGKIAPRNGSQANAFEEFCCHVASRCPDVPEGSEFVRLRGAGGDGGVECFWRLPNGEEWGWQAKYIFDLSSANAALDESVSTAIKVHPRLTRHTVCLPFDLTGPTGRTTRTGRTHKSQLDRFDQYRADWQAEAQAAGVNVTIVLATPTILIESLLSFDPQGGRLRYWFDETILGDEWFENHIEAAKASAYPRYTPELRIETPITESFEAFGVTEEWFASLAGRLRQFKQIVDRWGRATRSEKPDPSAAAFPETLQAEGERGTELLARVAERYRQIAIERTLTEDIDGIIRDTNHALELFREMKAALAADLEAKYGEGVADSVGFRQWQAEYQVSFPASNLDTAGEVIRFLEEFSVWISSPNAKLPGASALLVLGQAGVGKTHAVCDIAEMRARRKLRTIVLFGERFPGAFEPWEQIRQQLGFDATLSRDAMLAALDAAGEASGKPLMLCIDGLNETRPRTYWRAHLPSMIVELRPDRWIKLCVSCRTTYEDQVIPSCLHVVSAVHEGFKGREFNACHEYFVHYELEPPVTPILQPEFVNPLFLRLVCEAMKAGGYTRLPLGWIGINSAINEFIQAKNRAYAEQHGTLPNHRFPERALEAFMEAAEVAKRPALPWSEASRAIASVLPPSHSQDPLIDWLVREGLLIVDADPNPTTQTPEDYVRLAFERLGEHLLARKLLSGVQKEEDVLAEFSSGGVLAFTVSDKDAVAEYAGLMEALSVQLPERFGLELPDCIDDPDTRRELVKRTVTALLWRDPNHITDRTRDILLRAFSLPGFFYTAFDVALSISVHPSAADAFWFHKTLASRSMPDRDAFWCVYLHRNYEERGPVEKTIRAAFEVEVERIPFEVAERWATILLWFCAAADRRVRDCATKALVRITEPLPKLWESLLVRFISVDDEYVIERCLAAAYGTLLRVRDKSVEGAMARVTFDQVFRDSTRFQNAMIRDYARCILDLAAYDRVLPEGINEADYLPPYKSDWPLRIPTDEEMGQYSDSSEEMPKLHHSCSEDDFFVYILSRLDSFNNIISRASMGRWIFRHVLDMGYTGQRFSNYDGYMLHEYGGGRGRPGWAERIGKKYQWIALARLAARLTDNATPQRDSWDREPLRSPLSYAGGRDIDPSVLLRSSAIEKRSSWWFPEHYDFEAAVTLSDEEWTEKYDDMPDTHSMVSDRTDSNGKRWIVLEGHPEWTSKTPDMDWRAQYRLIWLQLRSYFIPADKCDAYWRWARKQDFFGEWMPEGAAFHEGFAGEYPWAVMFNLFEDSYLSRGGYRGKALPPCTVDPTSNSLYVNEKRDSYQEGSIGILLPARRFFEVEQLRWNGVNGYESSDGQLRFIDPSVIQPGPSTLLVDATYLRESLAANRLALTWTVIGEKLSIRSNPSPRLVYSRAHLLGPQGLRSSKPVITSR